MEAFCETGEQAFDAGGRLVDSAGLMKAYIIRK
jgi:hypothetical protein